MIDHKRRIGSVLLGCLAVFVLLPHAGRTLSHSAEPSSSTVHRDLGHIPTAMPLLPPILSHQTHYDRLACRQACEQVGFWDVEQEQTDRLVNACKIGCDLGQDHCL